MKRKIATTLVMMAVMLCFVTAVSRLETGRREEGKEHLEEVLRQTAAACYAAEGFYPPDLEYMCSQYGLRYDESRYSVQYSVFASNLMPDITVLYQGS